MSALALAPITDVAPAGFTGTLTAEQAERVVAEVHSALGYAQDLLRFAFRHKAHEALGYGTGQAGWDAFFADRFADVVFALPVAQRQLEVAKWNEAGASVRATATALGSSVGTISGDRKVVGQPENVVSLDGRQRDARAASTAAAKPGKALTTRVEELLLAAGPTGMTSAEVGARLRVGHNRYSPTVTRLEQQHRIVRTADRRQNHSVFVHPQWVVLEAEILD